MLVILLIAVALPSCWTQQYQGKVAPGVPPQNYQQQQQQYHPPPPQQHQVPVQPQFQQAPQGYQQQQAYQQVPQQQMHQQQMHQQQMHQQQVHQQQQVPQQQQGHQAQHGSHDHHGDPQLLNAANIAQEREHIQEHMDVPIDTSKMSEQELQFHYFKMHDADNNNKLDGCELIKSLIHWHAEGHKHHPDNKNQPPPGEKIFADDELINLIDPILNMDDNNKDGYIDYPEFIRAQQASQQQQAADKH